MANCTQCGDEYQVSAFGPKIRYVGLYQKCRKKKHTAVHIEHHRDQYLQKHRFYHKKRTYGLSAGEFEQLYTAQNGQCAICGAVFPPLSERMKRIAVDHNHATGAVRALLCIQCNTAVGMVMENVEIAERLVEYLKLHQSAGNRPV